MAGSVNKVIIIGNVGKDPEVRRINESTIVANLSLATTESYFDKTGKKIDNTEWHACEFWGGIAETVEKYVKKGHKLYVEGRLRTRSWTDDKEQFRTKVEIRVEQMVMLTKPEFAPGSNKPPHDDAVSGKTLPPISGLTPDEEDNLPF